MWFGWQKTGCVDFSDKVQVINADGSIVYRNMNVDGGYYDVNTYDGDSSEESLAFFDAVQEELESSNEEGLMIENDTTCDSDYFHSVRCV